MRLIFIYLLICLCSSSFTSRKYNSKSVNFRLEIKQLVLGSYTHNTFVITENKFYIFEHTPAEDSQLKRKEIYSKKIKQAALDEIIQASNHLYALDSQYIKASLGGIRWEIDLNKSENTKKIIIENNSLKEIDELFNLINKIIPNKKPLLYKY